MIWAWLEGRKWIDSSGHHERKKSINGDPGSKDRGQVDAEVRVEREWVQASRIKDFWDTKAGKGVSFRCGPKGQPGTSQGSKASFEVRAIGCGCGWNSLKKDPTKAQLLWNTWNGAGSAEERKETPTPMGHSEAENKDVLLDASPSLRLPFCYKGSIGSSIKVTLEVTLLIPLSFSGWETRNGAQPHVLTTCKSHKIREIGNGSNQQTFEWKKVSKCEAYLLLTLLKFEIKLEFWGTPIEAQGWLSCCQSIRFTSWVLSS